MPPHMNQTPDMDDAAVQPDSLSVRLQTIGLQRPGEALKQPERNISASRRIIPVNPEVVVFIFSPAGGGPFCSYFSHGIMAARRAQRFFGSIVNPMGWLKSVSASLRIWVLLYMLWHREIDGI